MNNTRYVHLAVWTEAPFLLVVISDRQMELFHTLVSVLPVGQQWKSIDELSHSHRTANYHSKVIPLFPHVLRSGGHRCSLDALCTLITQCFCLNELIPIFVKDNTHSSIFFNIVKMHYRQFVLIKCSDMP